MASNKKSPKDAQAVSAKKGDKFTYAESNTIVVVTLAHDDGTVDVQEPDGAQRYWGGVPANADNLKPVE